MIIPEIETERLLLRGFLVDDFEAHARLWTDPLVTRFIGGKPQSREEAWNGFIRHFGMWTAMGFGFWAVTDKKTGRMIGEAGFQDRQRDLTPSLDGTLEAGWTLLPETQGQGFASETLKAMLEWAGANHPGRPVTCIIDPANEPSLRLAERHGFREFARSNYHGSPTVMFKRQSG